MRDAIKSGTTEECFVHLMSRTFRMDPVPEMAAFTRIQPRAFGYKWLRNFTAKGEALLRLRYLLELMGYDVAELNALDPVVRDLGRLYAYDIATMYDLCVELDYEPSDNHGQMRKVLMGQRSMSAERVQLAQKFVKSFKDIMDQRRAELSTMRELVMESETVPSSSPVPTTRPVRAAPNANDAVIAAFAHSVQAMIPLARLLLSDQFSADERRRMRDLTGGTGVFDLSNLLNGLCGEKARDRAQNGGL